MEYYIMVVAAVATTIGYLLDHIVGRNKGLGHPAPTPNFQIGGYCKINCVYPQDQRSNKNKKTWLCYTVMKIVSYIINITRVCHTRGLLSVVSIHHF